LPGGGRVRKIGRSQKSRSAALSVCLPKRRGSRVEALPVCFEEALFLLLDLRPPGRGRRVLLGAAAPRSTPFHPPPATPLGIVHSSHPIPFGFQGKPPLWVPGSESRPSAHAPRWADHTRLAGRKESGRSASGEKQPSQSFRAGGMAPGAERKGAAQGVGRPETFREKGRRGMSGERQHVESRLPRGGASCLSLPFPFRVTRTAATGHTPFCQAGELTCHCPALCGACSCSTLRAPEELLQET